MAAWPPLQEARAGEFWRQIIRKELHPRCKYSKELHLKDGGGKTAAPKPTLYNHVYGAYSSKSTAPAHARTNQMASGWSSTAHSSAPSLKAHMPPDESGGLRHADGSRLA